MVLAAFIATALGGYGLVAGLLRALMRTAGLGQ
jgi:hypothetical protein